MAIDIKTERGTSILLFIMATIFVVLALLRAVEVPITHDEAYSYQNYINKPFEEIINSQLPTANNHILNSILSKVSINILGDTIFSLRLPNLLALIIYCISSIGLLKSLVTNRAYIVFGFLILLANPFMFEFWSLCRGYGLAIGFMMASSLQLIKFSRSQKLSTITLSYVFAILSVYSNFTILHYYVAVIIATGYIVIKSRAGYAKAIVSMLSATIVLLLLVAAPILILMRKGELYFGGDNGFIQDTVTSLVQESFYITHENLALVISVAICLLTLLSCIAVFKKKKDSFIWILLLVPVLSIISQHYLLGSKFLLGRTALFLYPLTVLVLLTSVTLLTKKASRFIMPVWVLLSIGTFLFRYNITSAKVWSYDQYTPFILDRMVALKENEEPIKVYLDWWFTPSIRYYTEHEYQGKFDYIEKFGEVAFEKAEYDYYYIQKWEIEKVSDLYIRDTSFADGNYLLYKKR